MRENMQLLCLWSWLTSYNLMSSNCIHLPLNMSLFLIAQWYSIVHMCHNLSVVGHLGCFQWLAIVNSAAVNISVQVSLLYPILCSFG
jgi:hypothetical protein